MIFDSVSSNSLRSAPNQQPTNDGLISKRWKGPWQGHQLFNTKLDIVYLIINDLVFHEEIGQDITLHMAR